ncbi:cytochrome C oxidase subunit II [Variovorax sp. J22R133]|uniref:cytochrome C oxidase subunit II n=1 Tax=Variovorax brevis TaxID=3053503 RepID=UPI002578BDA6|nr:cytochrome C oxidase subunit II [Variovorax sp. J22R133]MDM0111423.1 cytochrome C oxidase subunit II [Variovorax sp. J22R133]
MAETSPSATAIAVAEASERRWARVVAAIIALVFAVMIYSGLHWTAMAPARVETIDASTLHLSGEFMEANLGTAMQADRSAAVVRVIAQQYAFVPHCIVVPAQTPLTFRLTSPDVVHGFLIAGTNINSMVVPGYVSEVRARFSKAGEHVMPCHEYCSVGHEGMWARVKVLDKPEFERLHGSARRASCAG